MEYCLYTDGDKKMEIVACLASTLFALIGTSARIGSRSCPVQLKQPLQKSISSIVFHSTLYDLTTIGTRRNAKLSFIDPSTAAAGAASIASNSRLFLQQQDGQDNEKDHGNENRINYSSNSQEYSCPSSDFYIRQARYMELGHVVEILIDSFYKPSDLVRPYLYLHELSRLQNNFPHPPSFSSSSSLSKTTIDSKNVCVNQSGNDNIRYDMEHVFYVACTSVLPKSSERDRNMATMVVGQEKIVGFVEVDRRPGTKQNDPPRPYLSDLAVHRKYRRKGIAKALIQTCEKQVMEGWKQGCLYLRVDRENFAARNMYMTMGYEWQAHDYFGHGRDTTLLLKKEWEGIPCHGTGGDTCTENATAASAKSGVYIEKETIEEDPVSILDYVI